MTDDLDKTQEEIRRLKELRNEHNREFAIWRERRENLKRKVEGEDDEIKKNRIEEEVVEAHKNALQHRNLADKYHNEMVALIQKKRELTYQSYTEWLLNLPEEGRKNILEIMECDEIPNFDEITKEQKKKFKIIWSKYQYLKKLGII